MQSMTGLPSVDRPWMKYYPAGIEREPLPTDTLYSLLKKANQNNLSRTALLYFDRKISYRELLRHIEETARAFAAIGVKKGDMVTILSLNTPETIYAMYALNYLGAVANMQIAGCTAAQLRDNLIETDSRLLLILDKLYEKLEGFTSPVPTVVFSLSTSASGVVRLAMKLKEKSVRGAVSYTQMMKQHRAAPTPAPTEGADLTAIIVYTSGTTGQPKGVMLTNRNLNAMAHQLTLTSKHYQPGERFLNILPPFFSFGVGMSHLCLYTGMTQIIALFPKVNILLSMLQKYQPERFVLGPAITELIEEYPGKDMSFVIDVTGGGGAIAREKELLLNQILEQKHARSKYLAGYGMTELASAVALNFNAANKLQSIGIPLPHTPVKIVDLEHGQECGYDCEGELLIGGPNVMLGYYHNEAETAKTIETDAQGVRWLHTGDLAKIDRDGFIFITGRLKRIFIALDSERMAHKLFPQRVEDLVASLDCVSKCGVIAIEDAVRQHIPVVFVSCAAGVNKAACKHAVETLIHKQLPVVYAPAAIIVMDELPLTTSQKIDYRALERLYAAE